MAELCGLEPGPAAAAPIADPHPSSLPWKDRSRRQRLKEQLHQSEDWGGLAEPLADFVFAAGLSTFRNRVAWRIANDYRDEYNALFPKPHTQVTALSAAQKVKPFLHNFDVVGVCLSTLFWNVSKGENEGIVGV